MTETERYQSVPACRASGTDRLALGAAVDGGGSQQVEAAGRVQAAAALPAVAQAVVSVLHQRLTGPQDSLAQHAHGLAH